MSNTLDNPQTVSNAATTPTEAHNATSATTPSGNNPHFDTMDVEHPKDNPNVGLFTIKSANEWIDDASNRPMPSKLFDQLWFEGEICIMFADANVGKSILAVQIADAISRGTTTMGMAMDAEPQIVLYLDFELSDKQFELRYVTDDGSRHHKFSPNLKRIEINTDADYPEDCTFEDYVKQSLQLIVEQTGARIVIIDNLTFLCGDMEKSKNVSPLMKWLKAFKKKSSLSILVLAHTLKRRNLSQPITDNDLFGSSMFKNFADGMFAIGQSAKDKQTRYIKELKQRNLSYKYHSDNVIICEVEKPDDFIQLRYIGVGYEAEHLKQFTMDDKEVLIEQVKDLHSHGKSQREISNKLGISVGCVNNYINK